MSFKKEKESGFKYRLGSGELDESGASILSEISKRSSSFSGTVGGRVGILVSLG